MDMITLLLAATISLPPFGDVKVVDEIDCTKTDHRFADWPKGASRVEKVLGKKVDKEGKEIKFDVKKGDTVLLPKYGGTEVKLDGKKLQLVREEDLLGVIEK